MKFKFFPRKLYQQTILIVTLIMVASNISYSQYVSNHNAEKAVEEKKQNALIIAENLATFIANRLVVGDYAGMDHYLLQSAKLPDVIRLSVVEHTGTVLSNITNDNLQEPKLIHERSEKVFRDIEEPVLAIDDMHMEIIHPVKVYKHIANLHIVFSLEEINKMRQHLWLHTMYVGMFWLILTTMFLLFILRIPIKAFINISGFARRLGNTRGEQIDDTYLTDELQGLADSLNYASKRIYEAEKDLRAERERLDATMQSINEGVIATDIDLRIILINNAAEKMTGWEAEDAIGRHISEVFTLESNYGNELNSHGLERTLVQGEVVEHNEAAILVSKTREECSIEFSEAPIRDRSGDIFGAVIVLRDIAEKLKIEEEKESLEEQLRQAQKMESIGTLAGGIAHDFNNVLTPIIGYSEMIKMNHVPSDKTFEYAKEIMGASIRAKELVDQILTFSRQSEHEMKPLAIDTIVKEAIKLLRSSIPTTIEIKYRISPDCGHILGDPTKVHQIMMNLCTNAYHAMRESGGVLGIKLNPINISANDYPAELMLEAGKYICLEVSDTGYGIPDDLKDKIFEPYFTTKNRKEGTGLGLSVVHGIMKSLKGHITVYSELGLGTTFRLYFPEIHEDIDEAEAVAPVLKTGNETVLLVDDDYQVLDLEKRVLESLGYKPELSQSSLQALELLRKKPDKFDLVITDMTMPEMTGAQLAQKIIEISPNMPIILCTGFSDIISEEKAIALGIRKYITKPLIISQFTDAIREVLDA